LLQSDNQQWKKWNMRNIIMKHRTLLDDRNKRWNNRNHDTKQRRISTPNRSSSTKITSQRTAINMVKYILYSTSINYTP
jgi:hypothetical protein